MARERTNPETPTPKAIAREYVIGEMATDLVWIKAALSELKTREHPCIKERELEGLSTWRKGLSAILAAVAMTLLGSISVAIATCSQQAEARGIVTTRIENHSDRLIALEQAFGRAEQARQIDTTNILSAIQECERSAASGPDTQP